MLAPTTHNGITIAEGQRPRRSRQGTGHTRAGVCRSQVQTLSEHQLSLSGSTHFPGPQAMLHVRFVWPTPHKSLVCTNRAQNACVHGAVNAPYSHVFTAATAGAPIQDDGLLAPWHENFMSPVRVEERSTAINLAQHVDHSEHRQVQLRGRNAQNGHRAFAYAAVAAHERIAACRETRRQGKACYKLPSLLLPLVHTHPYDSPYARLRYTERGASVATQPTSPNRR